MKTFEQIMAELPRARRAKIEADAKKLIAEEKALRKVREARKLTQQHMAKLLGVDQGSVSKLEGRTDMLLSTLRSYIAAMGGSLRMIAAFPDGKTEIVSLGENSDIEMPHGVGSPKRSAKRARTAARA